MSNASFAGSSSQWKLMVERVPSCAKFMISARIASAASFAPNRADDAPIAVPNGAAGDQSKLQFGRLACLDLP